MTALRRGQRTAGHTRLDRTQELELIDTLRGRYPDQFGLDDELWSRHSLAALVQDRFRVRLEPADAASYLRSWGIGPREPTDRACELCVNAVNRWLVADYPAILRNAEEHGAELCWIGRTRLRGVMPAAEIIHAASVRGQLRFMITTPGVDPALPRDFLLRLSGADGRSVHLVVDGSWSRGEWPRRLPAHLVPHPLPNCGLNR